MRRAFVSVVLLVGVTACVALAAAIAAGVVGDVVVEEPAREPLERTKLAPGRAAILETEGRECPGDEPAIPSSVEAWRSLVGEFSWSAQALSPVDGGRLGGLALAVLPSGSCLSPGEAAGLRRFVREGGGLLAAGTVGSRTSGRAPDFAFLRELLGAERLETLPDERPALVAFAQGCPLAAGLEALSLAPPRRPRVLAVALGPQPYWSDSRLLPLDPSLPRSYHSAAVTSSYGKGRVAWLGFAARLEAGGTDAARTRRLLRTAAAWAAGQPVVSLAPWPARYGSAVLLRANVAGQQQNSSFVARTLLDAGVRGAFVLAVDSVDELAGAEPQLARAGEIALAMRSSRPGTTAARLSAAAARLRVRRELGVWPSGLLEATTGDAQAARAAAAWGLDFVLLESAAGSARPSAWRAVWRFGPWRRERDVVSFSRWSDDDLGLSPLGVSGLETQWLRRRLLVDFDAAAALGGLHLLSFHTQGLGTPERVETLAWLVRESQARGAWVAGPAELAAWWRARAGLQVVADASAPGRLGVRVRASATAPAQAVAIDVHAPPGTRAVVEPGSADCEVGGRAAYGAERLLVRVGSEPRDYRCDVAFVR
jgi:hypothetical protein